MKRSSPLRLVTPPSTAVPDAVQARVPVPSLDDNELVAAVRDGDAAAATAFYTRLFPRVDATVRRLLGRVDPDHEDLVQLSMIETVRSLVRYRGECSLEGWAAAVTARLVYKHLRRRSTERRIFSGEPIDAAAPASSAARLAIARDMVARVRRHLDAIEEEKSWTFLLHDVCGFDLREIAEITGVSVAAAQTRLVRGRRELHDRLARDPELAQSLGDPEVMS